MKLPFEALELMHIHPSLRVETLTSHNFNNNRKWSRNFYNEGLARHRRNWKNGRRWKKWGREWRWRWWWRNMKRMEVEMREDNEGVGGEKR